MTDTSILNLTISSLMAEGRNQVYVILDDPVTLIDSGLATSIAYGRLIEQLAKHNLTVKDIGRVILTHKHIDHIGNAWRIQRESDAEILIHESEVPAVNDTDARGGRHRILIDTRLAEWKVPQKAQPKPSNATRGTWEIESATASGLVDGQKIEMGSGELEVIHTPGHTHGSICLKYGRHLFSGDHVLPAISPNVGGGDMRRRGLLIQYLGSLRRIIKLGPMIDMVYPGHGDPFDHLVRRCNWLIDHHHTRLEKITGILAEEGTVSIYHVASKLFGELRDYHVILGCAEAQAHLEYLVDDGRVVHHEHQYCLA